MESSQKQPETLRYNGSPKHARGGWGSKYPKWTHEMEPANEGGDGGDADKHDWSATLAQKLLEGSILDGKRRYATARNLPFCARSDNHGTWHGYPISWREVPESVKRAMIERGDVTMMDIKRQMKKDTKTKR